MARIGSPALRSTPGSRGSPRVSNCRWPGTCASADPAHVDHVARVTAAGARNGHVRVCCAGSRGSPRAPGARLPSRITWITSKCNGNLRLSVPAPRRATFELLARRVQDAITPATAQSRCATASSLTSPVATAARDAKRLEPSYKHAAEI